MAYNGSGTFLINTAGQPVVPNTVISATAFNALTNDLANGLSTCITKDGQTTPTANIPMGNNKITGLAPGTSGTDAANLSQVQGSTAKLLQSVTGTDTITAAMVPALTSYSAGQMFYFVAVGDNTGAVTINIDSLGAKSVTRDGSTALVAGDIVSGEVALIVYDGTRFQLLNGNSFTNLNVSNNLTLSGGTANGVLYLNGSKVATSGSALVFDGTNLGIGTSSPGAKLSVNGAATVGTATQASNAALTLQESASNSTAIVMTNRNSTQSWGIAVDAAAVDDKILAFIERTGSNVRMALTDSGNLGLGVTPSAWASLGYGALQVGRAAVYSAGVAGYLSANTYYAGAYYYIADGFSSRLSLENGGVNFYTAASGTAGNTISFGDPKMTLDASGNLLVGKTSSGLSSAGRGLIDVNGSSEAFYGLSTGGTARAYLAHTGTNLVLMNAANGTLEFGTNNTERGRFSAEGYFKASNNGTYNSSTGAYHELKSTTAGLPSTFIQNTNANPYGAVINFTSTLDNNTNYFLNCEDNTAVRCYIWSDGDLANHDGVYGTISDERLKQDIVDAGSQWDDLKAIRFRKYRMKTDVEANPDAPAMFGVVAQELAQVCPGLVDEHIDRDGEITKTVKSSILLMKAAKALQEAMARIESLEAKVAALEAK